MKFNFTNSKLRQTFSIKKIIGKHTFQNPWGLGRRSPLSTPMAERFARSYKVQGDQCMCAHGIGSLLPAFSLPHLMHEIKLRLDFLCLCTDLYPEIWVFIFSMWRTYQAVLLHVFKKVSSYSYWIFVYRLVWCWYKHVQPQATWALARL